MHSIASIECVCRDGESCACAHVDVRRLTHAGSNSNRRSLSVYVHTYTCTYVAIDIAAAVNLGVRLSLALLCGSNLGSVKAFKRCYPGVKC